MDKKSTLILYDDAQKLNEQIVALAEKLKLLADSPNHLPNNELYIFAITIFILTCFIGYHIVYRARPAFYQVLIVMSSTMSGIAIISVFSVFRETQLNFSTLFSFFMIVVLSATIVAGLIITYHMLKIFSKKHDV